MRSRLAAGLAALCILALFLLFTWPAERWLSGLPEPLAVQAPEGTLWRGQAAVLAAGPLRFESLRWRLRPASLALGRLGFRLTTGSPAIEARIAAGLTGRWWLRMSRAELPAEFFRPLLDRWRIEASGRLLIRELAASGRGDWPDRLEGALVWKSAALAAPLKLPLGGLQARLHGESDALLAELADQGGPLALAGSARLERDGHYRLDLSLRPRADAPPTLRDALGLLGAPDASGAYRLRATGVLASRPGG